MFLNTKKNNNYDGLQLDSFHKEKISFMWSHFYESEENSKY